ncbi:hypothetical protein Golob_013578, partial [Gossypium lobatum]|nr:hypothetical protein [Gossypium lobatum]
MKVKSYYDNLASCGEIISDNEHVIIILNGLSLKYEPVIMFITTSQVPYSVQGVTTMLLDVEARKTGHLVDRCYYRFDVFYKSVSYRPPLQANACEFAHVTTSYWSNSFNAMPQSTNAPFSPTLILGSSPQAYISTPNTIGDNAWYPNSSATRYLTYSTTSMGESAPYSGP